METLSGAPMGEMDFQIAAMEQQFTPEVGPNTLWSAETRQAHLESLPAYGFSPDQYADTISQIVEVGLPVNNFQSLSRRPNTAGREDHLGSWTYSGENTGEFSLYDLLDRLVPEQRMATIAHESMHANTPLAIENSHLFGSEANRSEAAQHVRDITNQSLVTGVHLNGYHKWLIAEHAKGSIDNFTLAEETSAIMAEMALTNRTGLEIVQARQHAALEDINRINSRKGLAIQPKTPILSSENGGLAGVDKTLSRLFGFSSQEQLVDHVHILKTKLYSSAAFDKVLTREFAHTQIMDGGVIAFDGLRIILRYIEDEDQKDRKTKTSH